MKKIRVLLAKPGLDGHDRGVKVVAKALRDAGMEVLYTGLHNSIPAVAKTAVQEDVDVIGLSVLSGSHLTLTSQLVSELRRFGVSDKIIVIGGTIPPGDVPKLESAGVSKVFPVGTPLSRIPKDIAALVEAHHD